MQSGTSLISWSWTYEPTKWAFEAGRKLGFNGDDPKELVKHIRTEPAEEIVKTMLEILRDVLVVYISNGIFQPLIHLVSFSNQINPRFL